MGSPSKGLMYKALGRQQLRESFLRGVLVGLLIIFCWMSMKLMLWGRSSGDAETGMHVGDRQRLMAFVGVQVNIPLRQ